MNLRKGKNTGDGSVNPNQRRVKAVADGAINSEEKVLRLDHLIPTKAIRVSRLIVHAVEGNLSTQCLVNHHVLALLLLFRYSLINPQHMRLLLLLRYSLISYV